MWVQLLVRAFAAFVGLSLLRGGIHGLRGRALMVPKGRGDHAPVHELRGWSARFSGALALVFALWSFAFALRPWE